LDARLRTRRRRRISSGKLSAFRGGPRKSRAGERVRQGIFTLRASALKAWPSKEIVRFAVEAAVTRDRV
jgi:hypothetical protein